MELRVWLTVCLLMGVFVGAAIFSDPSYEELGERLRALSGPFALVSSAAELYGLPEAADVSPMPSRCFDALMLACAARDQLLAASDQGHTRGLGGLVGRAENGHKGQEASGQCQAADVY